MESRRGRGMRRPFRWRILVLVLAVAWLSVAAEAAQEPARPDKVFLWTIASPTATVHLMGSVHVASAETYPLSPRIESAFAQAETLVLEMALDPAMQVRLGQSFASAGTYPIGDTIDLHVNRRTLEMLQERVNLLGIPLSTLRSYRPWFVATLLTLTEMQRLGYRPDLGVDLYFAGKARGGKRILGLETPDEQIGLFAGMSEAVQEQMLLDTLSRFDLLRPSMDEALRSWRTGNAGRIEELLVAPMRTEHQEVYQRIFADRNHRMAGAIEGYLKASGHYFVVVGAGHLVGPDGILTLLQRKGYATLQE